MAVTRSRAKAPRGYTGPIPEAIWEVLQAAWEKGISVQSDGARFYAPQVALAASLGWISTVSLNGREHLRIWNITEEGVNAYTHHHQNSAPR